MSNCLSLCKSGFVEFCLKFWCRMVTFFAETRSAWCRRTARRWSCGRRRSRPTASWTTTDNILPSHRRLPACTGIRISQVTSLLAIRMAHSPSTLQVFDTHVCKRAPSDTLVYVRFSTLRFFGDKKCFNPTGKVVGTRLIWRTSALSHRVHFVNGEKFS